MEVFDKYLEVSHYLSRISNSSVLCICGTGSAKESLVDSIVKTIDNNVSNLRNEIPEMMLSRFEGKYKIVRMKFNSNNNLWPDFQDKLSVILKDWDIAIPIIEEFNSDWLTQIEYILENAFPGRQVLFLLDNLFSCFEDRSEDDSIDSLRFLQVLGGFYSNSFRIILNESKHPFQLNIEKKTYFNKIISHAHDFSFVIMND